MSKINSIYRGEIYYANLSPVIGSEQGGNRPVLILQNNMGNKHSPTTIVAPITSCQVKKPLPTHVPLNTSYGLACDSVVLCEQIRTIDKTRLLGKVGLVDDEIMKKINKATIISLGLI